MIVITIELCIMTAITINHLLLFTMLRRVKFMILLWHKCWVFFDSWLETLATNRGGA